MAGLPTLPTVLKKADKLWSQWLIRPDSGASSYDTSAVVKSGDAIVFIVQRFKPENVTTRVLWDPVVT